MKGIFAWVGFRSTTIEYVRDPRFTGKSRFTGWKLGTSHSKASPRSALRLCASGPTSGSPSPHLPSSMPRSSSCVR